jgi:hypothetical protein
MRRIRIISSQYGESRISDAISEKAREEFNAAKDAFAEKGITLAEPDSVSTINITGRVLPDAVKDLSDNSEDRGAERH